MSKRFLLSFGLLIGAFLMLLIAAAPPRFATIGEVNDAASNKVVVLGGTSTTVAKTSTNGVNYYAVSSSASGGSVNYADFYGTNGVNTLTNPATGKIVIGPSTPISTIASNAAKSLNLWTNDGVVTRLSTGTNHVGIADPSDLNLNPSFSFGLFVGNPQVTSGSNALYSQNGVNYGIYGNCSTQPTTKETAGVIGAGNYGALVSYGVVGFASGITTAGVPNSGVAVAGTSFQESGANNRIVGGYFEVGGNYASFPNPVYQSSALLLDNRATGLPLITARTNNGTYIPFQVLGTKTTNATPLDVAGLTTLHGGTAIRGPGTNINVLDTNGTTFTSLYTQGGTLYSSASPPNQTVAVEEWAVMSGRAIVTGIDGKSVGNTTLYTVPTGRQLVVQQIVLVPTDVDTLAVAATASVGRTAATYVDVIAATALTGLATVNSAMILSPIVNANVLQSEEALVLRVSTGATATTFTFKAIVVGLLL